MTTKSTERQAIQEAERWLSEQHRRAKVTKLAKTQPLPRERREEAPESTYYVCETDNDT
jgi:hypothetical protein